MKTNSATNAQIAASDAKLSTWLTANAGSGKTKVLIDRVARYSSMVYSQSKFYV